jgi:hypothetical protein
MRIVDMAASLSAPTSVQQSNGRRGPERPRPTTREEGCLVDPVDPAQEPATQPRDRRTEPRRAWLRVGSISAVLWIVLGLPIAYLSDRLGAPTWAGPLGLLSGPVILRIVGRRQGLHDSWAWTQAWLFQLGFALLIASVALYMAVLGGLLGPGDSPGT